MTRTTKPQSASLERRGLAGIAAIIGLWIMAAGLIGTANAQEASKQLQDIEVQSLPNQQIELRLILSGPAEEPLSFTIDNPARIALDLPDTSLGLTTRRRDINLGALDTVLTAEANGRTRVVLNLDSMTAYDTRAEGNSIIVTLGDARSTAGSAEPTFSSADPAPVYVAESGSRSIGNVDFRRTREGGGRIIVDLTDPSTAVDIRQEGGRVIAEFRNTELPTDLMRRLDVQDFATPVQTIDAIRVNSDARIMIAAEGAYEQLAYQSDNVFTIEINPVKEVEEGTEGLFSEDKNYDGERVSLNFQDIETRAVLQLLAEISGQNIVVADTVQGNVTLRLNNVPWDQALDIVLTTKGLDMRANGNVIIVAPAEEIAAREKAELEARAQIKELEPLYSEFLQVNYAKASDLAELIQSTGESAALLSERGSVAIDERTNTLLVQDTGERLRNIRRMVATLDIPVKQVMIETRIVIVNDDFSREFGVRLGLTAVQENSSDGLFSVTGNSAGSGTLTESALDNLQNTGQPFPVTAPQINNRYNVNLPVASPAGQIALAVLDSDYIVDLELSALQAEGQGEVVSTPRVITANQREAIIRQGVEIPFQESSASGATTTQFKDAVLSLTVTPQITPDNNIIMDLLVSKDSVGELVASATGGFVPSIDTREVQTQVLVHDGQTVVLGGIYETERSKVESKVPVLGDIPGLRNFFRSTRNVSNKSELLIFVTPRILNEDVSVY